MATSLRSSADGLCLTTSPLRFAPCTASMVWEPALKDGELSLISGASKLRAKDGTRGAVTRLCTDRFCVRCIGRGNGNSAKFGLCASGGEEVRLMPPVGLLGDSAYSLPLLLLLLLVPLLLMFLPALLERKPRSKSRQQEAYDPMYDPNALAKSHEKLEQAREETRRLRLSLRATRDESRPVRLLQRMLAGEKFSELDERSLAREVWLELSKDQNRMCVFAWRRTAASEPLYEIDLAALRKIAFGQSSHPAARSLQYAQTPWRCFSLEAGSLDGVAPDGGDHFYVGARDESALLWVQGLQSLLYSAGQLEQPLPPAKLLWMRARMRLLQRASRHKSSSVQVLAGVLRSAAP